MFRVSNKTEFAQWFQIELGKRDWTQSDFSKRSGLHRSIVSKIVLGTSMPTPETLDAIAKGFGMSPAIVFQKAGLLPPTDADDWIEQQAHKMSLLTPGKRPMAERLLDALLEEDQQSAPVVVRKTARSKG